VPTQSEGLFRRVRNRVAPVTSRRWQGSNKAPGPVGGGGGSSTGGIVQQFLGASRQTSSVKRGSSQFLQAYNELPWFRAATGKIAGSISGIEWMGLTEDPETEQLTPLNDLLEGVKHPIEIFFDQPHPFFSWQTITFLWTIHLKTVGECFGVWDKTPEGLQIWPIVPTQITKLPTPEEEMFTLSLPTGQFQIPVDEIFWMIDPDPTSLYARGSGLAQCLDDELSTDEEAAKTIRAFFEHQARPDILITGKGLNPEKTKRIEEEWVTKQSGFWNAFKPHFMSEVVDVREFKQDFQSMQFVELRKYERDSIIQVFGIPPEIVGILQNSNRATIEAADLFFAKYTLTPILNQMREAFQKQLVPKFDDNNLIEVDFVSPVQENKEYQLSVVQAAPWAFLKDEIRAMADQEPLPDGKGQVFMVPMALTEVPLEEPEAIAPEPVAPQAPQEPQSPQEEPAPPTTEGAVLMSENASKAKQIQRASQAKRRRVVMGRGSVIYLRR
jgi:hypothetical protein